MGTELNLCIRVTVCMIRFSWEDRTRETKPISFLNATDVSRHTFTLSRQHLGSEATVTPVSVPKVLSSNRGQKTH
jgi:hypothetical protein